MESKPIFSILWTENTTFTLAERKKNNCPNRIETRDVRINTFCVICQILVGAGFFSYVVLTAVMSTHDT